MDIKKERDDLIRLAQGALEKIKDVIPSDLDETTPEKLKLAVQGKIEAINACENIIATIERLNELNDESDPSENEEKDSIFFGAESLIGK